VYLPVNMLVISVFCNNVIFLAFHD